MARLEFTGMSAESVKPFLRERLTPGPGQPAWKIIPAISLAQPWATWIAMGWKTIETRRHNRLDRIIGRRIAIHASKTWDSSSLDVAGQYLTTAQIQRHGLMTSRNMYPKGELVCLATVTSGGPMDQPADAAAALCDFHGGVGYRLATLRRCPSESRWPARSAFPTSSFRSCGSSSFRCRSRQTWPTLSRSRTGSQIFE